MKKSLALLLAVMLILSGFTACGSKDEGEIGEPSVDAGQDLETGMEEGTEEGTEDGSAAEGDAESDAEDGSSESQEDAEQDAEQEDNKEESKPADKPASSDSSSASGNTSDKPADKEEAKAPSGTPAEIIDMIYAEHPVKDLPLGTIEIDINDADALKMFTGLSSADKIEAAAASESMMGSQAYSLIVVKVKKEKDAETVMEEMINGIDTRKWICVEADDLSAAAAENVVVLMMVGSDHADVATASGIIDAFRAVCGGLDARV